MPYNSSPLLKSECPLLPESSGALVDRYSAAAAQLEVLRAEAGGLSGFAEPIAKIEADMVSARAKLERKRYRVGFLGTTAAGKSTTFNNILQVSEEDAPAKLGGGPATTAAPARLRRSAAGQQTLRLNFMTDAEYQARKIRLAAHLKLGEVLTEDDLLAQCDDLRHRLEGREILDVQLPDVIALQSLIESRRKYQKLVSGTAQRHSKPGEYALRSEYLNHPFEEGEDPKKALPKPAENRLLWEVEIEFPNGFLPTSLEMIDLPGLGATGFHDTCVTLDIIENTGPEGLDGALLFINSGQLSDDSVVEIIRKLRGAWNARFQGRVWAVFTKFDTLTRPHYAGTPNFFSGVHKLLSDSDIPENCVFIVSNEVAKLQTSDMDEAHCIETAAIKLSRKPDDPLLTQHYRPYPYFEPIIGEVYRNGGVAYLRTAIVERLGAMIGLELADDARRLLDSIERGIEAGIKGAQRRKTQTSQDQERATECAKVLNRMIQRVRRGLPEFRAATLTVRDGMRDTVAKYSPVDDLSEMSSQDVPSSFRMLANRLDQATQNLLIERAVEPIYGTIQNALRDLPEVPLCGAESIQMAWANSMEADCDRENWKRDIPRFEQADLIEKMCGAADRLQGVQFKALLENKIHAVALVTMFRVRERLMQRLTEFSGELKLLVTEQ